MVIWAKQAAACAAAEALYYLAAQFHGRAILPWDRLSAGERHERVESAFRALEQHPPSRGITVGPDYFGESADRADATVGRVLAFLHTDAPMGGNAA
jgi:hypothetical protein